MREPKFHRRFGYDAARLPNAFLASLEAGVSTIEEAREKSGASIGYPGWSVLYYCLLASLHPQRRHTLIETGTNHGASTIMLAQALVDAGVEGEVHTFELDEEIQGRARKNIAAAGLEDRVVHHLGDSSETLPRALEQIEGVISGAFIDGGHGIDLATQEFAAVHPRLARGALVFLDNTYPIGEVDKGEDPRVNGALRMIQDRFGGALINLPFVSWYTPGLAIWQQEPPLEFEDWEA
jgi:predicted O-methyltransferase YrrM